jgi:hypothetical protein
MSALPPKTDTLTDGIDVRLVTQAEVGGHHRVFYRPCRLFMMTTKFLPDSKSLMWAIGSLVNEQQLIANQGSLGTRR